MLVWEVIRNAERNFTDDFEDVYGRTSKYKEPEHYGIKTNLSGCEKQWKEDTKTIKYIPRKC